VRMICVGENNCRPRSRRRRYEVSAGCCASHREMVEAATWWPYRDESFSAVASSVLPRSYSDSASKISGRGYILLRIARGPTVKLRPHARQRKMGTSSCFFLRVPFLMRRLLLQWGQRSGGLIFDSRGVASAVRPTKRRDVPAVRECICRVAYHARRRICKKRRPLTQRQGSVEYANENAILQASDLQGAGDGGACG
jgi:hypothetical protein